MSPEIDRIIDCRDLTVRRILRGVDTPKLDQQREFWDAWNIENRVGVSDELTTKQANEAHREAQALLRKRGSEGSLRILEVGLWDRLAR